MQTFTYKVSDQYELKGTFYEIEKKQAPLIMYIHGGGLVWGSKDDIDKRQIEWYNNAGFHVFSIDYRLAPESKIDLIVKDIQDAITWLMEHGHEHIDFDPENIAVIGSSAGGYLALLTGTMHTRPKAIVSFYGYGDITGDWYMKPSPHFTKMTPVPEKLAKQLIQDKPITASPIERRYAIYLYCRQQGKWIDYVTGIPSNQPLDVLQKYCPARLIDSHYPPTLLLHGDADEDVPYGESVNMAHELEQSDIPHELITIKDGKHSFDENMDDAAVKNAFEKVIAFLHEHLQ